MSAPASTADAITPDSAQRLAPFTPSGDDAQKVGLRLLQLTDDDVFFDVGCGDGRVLIAAAMATEISARDNMSDSSASSIQRIRCIGVELDPLLCSRAVEAVLRLPMSVQSLIQIRCGDVLQPETIKRDDAVSEVRKDVAPIVYMDNLTLHDDCTALYLYLLPQGLVRLKPLLDEIVSERRRKLIAPFDSSSAPRRLSFRVVTYMFQIHGWIASAVDRTSKAGAPVYLYEFDCQDKGQSCMGL